MQQFCHNGRKDKPFTKPLFAKEKLNDADMFFFCKQIYE